MNNYGTKGTVSTINIISQAPRNRYNIIGTLSYPKFD